jgi:UDP-N-acetylglucosamine 2-epimerase
MSTQAPNSSLATKVMVVVGARPNFVKVAPILRAMQHHNLIGSHPVEPVLVHTGQH